MEANGNRGERLDRVTAAARKLDKDKREAEPTNVEDVGWYQRIDFLVRMLEGVKKAGSRMEVLVPWMLAFLLAVNEGNLHYALSHWETYQFGALKLWMVDNEIRVIAMAAIWGTVMGAPTNKRASVAGGLILLWLVFPLALRIWFVGLIGFTIYLQLSDPAAKLAVAAIIFAVLMFICGNTIMPGKHLVRKLNNTEIGKIQLAHPNYA